MFNGSNRSYVAIIKECFGSHLWRPVLAGVGKSHVDSGGNFERS